MFFIQKIMASIKMFFCWHKFKKMAWHGLPNEPDLMRCQKCGAIKKFDYKVLCHYEN